MAVVADTISINGNTSFGGNGCAINPIAVSVAPAIAVLYPGQVQQFTAMVTNTYFTAVLWSISPAGVGTIDASGVYTAPASVSWQQPVTVTATSQADSTNSASATVTLFPPISIAVSPAAATLYGGQHQQFSASVMNKLNTAVSWSISPASLGTIDVSGVYTASASIPAQQTVTVTATSQANSTVSASATVTLLPMIAVSVSPPTATLSGGQTQQFTATVTNSNNTAVTWSISPAGDGTIDASGNYTAPSAISTQQTVTVTATSQADTTKSSPPAYVTLCPKQCTSNGYSHERSIVINHTEVPNTDQIDFPALFSGTYPYLDLASAAHGGMVQSENGHDIIFTSDSEGKNLLDFEIDNYNSTTGLAAFWVRIPVLSHSTDSSIYMWYGNAGIASSQENKAGVWKNNYLSVYHFGSGTELGMADSGSARYKLTGSATS